MEVFWNMTHNLFILEYANGILIVFVPFFVFNDFGTWPTTLLFWNMPMAIVFVPFFVFNSLISVTNFQISNVYISVLSLYKRNL